MINALRKQIRVERFVNITYACLAISLLVYVIIDGILAVSQRFVDYDLTQIIRNPFVAIISVIFCYTAYIVEICTIIYFSKMGSNYIQTMKNHYDINPKTIQLNIKLLSLWILACNFNTYIYVQTASLISMMYFDNSDYLYSTSYEILPLILGYMGKLIPLMLVTFISMITAFLAKGSQ